ncbi:MAG: efflux RND transporter periplasmic adaptor subunit [Verrucomicrobia bacterium]|nr:efflux RND transporter periplasmic adaptor subunit [Verrucomicrobiota bacterium]
MKKIIIPVILVLLVALAVGIFFAYKKEKKSNELVLFGNVDVRQVDISFRVPGKVAQLMFEEGDCVEKGALMAVLDKAPYDSEISQAEANVASIKANLENANILLSRRYQAVGFGGVSCEDLNNAQASSAQLLANLNAAEAALRIALDNMSFTEVRAPTDGIILTRIREPGTVVSPSEPVYTLSVTSPVWIRAFVDETALGKIFYGMKAEIHTDSGKVYQGQIGFISPVAEFTPKTVETAKLRTDLVYRLRVYADNPDHFLKQGMPVTVKLRLDTEEQCD